MSDKQKHDLMDVLVSDWTKECPELDPSAMLLVGRIMRLGRKFETQATEVLKPLGLSYTEFDIIATLRRSGVPYELTPGQLGGAVLLTSGAMTAALDRLEKARFITRHVSRSDRRVKTAKLTTSGKRVSLKAATARFNAASDAISELSEKQRDSLAQLLLNCS
ncbi:MAG: MarR family winged helix-turn-helix transcriptional regulator [Gammaproteobacteria bacterium]